MTCEPGRIPKSNFYKDYFDYNFMPNLYPYTFTFLSDSIPKDTVDENPIDEIPDRNVAALTANGIDPAGKYIKVFESYTLLTLFIFIIL